MSEVWLDDGFLQRLVTEYDTPEVTAFGLSGSFARGDAHRYSDIDLLRFVRAQGDAAYQLHYVEGKLLSLTTISIAHERDKLRQPRQAIWNVPMLRRMRILLDRDGELALLQRAAESFEWDSLRAEAQTDASRDLVGYIEEAHKVMGALARNDDAALAYATIGVVMGMVNIAAVANGVLIHSESRYFREVGTALGSNSAWTHEMRLALGLEGASTVQERALAALRLYRETARLLQPILHPEDKAMIDACCTILDQHTIGE